MRIRRFYRLLLLLAGLSTVALGLALQDLHGLRTLELGSVDTRFAIRGARTPPRKVLVVSIDTATFNYLAAHHPSEAHFPFHRRLDARVIANLKRDGARVIAYDEQFTEQTDAGDDNALIAATRAAGNVVLATTEVAADGSTRIFGGDQGLAYSRARAADSQIPLDADGINRRLLAQVQGLPSFPVESVQRASGRPVHFPGGADASAWIDFPGPAGTVRTVSYWRVLENKFTPGAFRGQIVVVGATAQTLQDYHRVSAGGAPMAGPEVQASAIDTVLNDFPLRPAPRWLEIALILLFGLLAPLAALWLRALLAAGLALAALVLFALACQLAFDSGTIVGFVYPALVALLSCVATLVLAGARVAYEREHVRDAFARFVPESVVGQVLAEAGGLRLGGVRREATVLFSDLRGFTTFAEQREPDQTIEILNRYLTAMSEAILDHGGTLVGYMGDGVMAVFGAPIEQPDHAARALAAARTMLARLEEFNAWVRAAGHGEGFKMGIGLNSGSVMSGNVGSERRLEYTTIGDATNTAARLESMTKGTPYQLYLSQSTCAQLPEQPADLIEVGELEVRGRAARVSVWALAASGGVESSSAEPGRAEPPVAEPVRAARSRADRPVMFQPDGQATEDA